MSSCLVVLSQTTVQRLPSPFGDCTTDGLNATTRNVYAEQFMVEYSTIVSDYGLFVISAEAC